MLALKARLASRSSARELKREAKGTNLEPRPTDEDYFESERTWRFDSGERPRPRSPKIRNMVSPISLVVDDDRAAQLYIQDGDKGGSGYAIKSNCILTARHILCP